MRNKDSIVNVIEAVKSKRRDFPNETCKACDNRTTERKPYCIDHLTMNSDYVASLANQDDIDGQIESDIMAALYEKTNVPHNQLTILLYKKKHIEDVISRMLERGRIKKILRGSSRHKAPVITYSRSMDDVRSR